ncbi:hypothetical protein KPL71_014192 [Citrus sinensis]|nr:hypothetical protein KPL71_014192 [Citrus sinensis]
MMEEDEEEISDDDADEMEGFTRGVDAESAGTTAERERQRATMADLIIIKMATETIDDIPYIPVSSSVAAPTLVKEPASVAIPVNHAERPEKFNGQNFKRWQQKMFFYLTTLNLARFLTEDASKPKEGETDIQVASAIDAWHHSDFLCKNYVMNGLSDSLYNVYIGKKTAKELWESLDRKYKTEDVGTKKFVVGRFLDYKMVDSKTVISQVQELQIILSEILAEGMHLSETFQVTAIIEKLPPAWKDFKSYLKHKRKEMNIEGMVIKLRIEEDNRNAERRGAIFMAKANFVEHGPKNKNKKLGPKGGISKKQTKFQGKCYNCDKMGHKASDCRLPKKKREANVVENITQHVSDINLSTVISEVNLVGSNPREWWIDTGATRHVCSDKGLFTSFEPVSNEEKLFMGNSVTSEIEGQGKVILKMTSGKELTLNNVLYVLEIQKNLVSGSLLSKHGFRMVFESDRVVLSKNGMYVGKGYVNDGLLKLNVMTLKPTINNKATSSACLLESSNLWHSRLGHVNFNSLRKLINMKHIPNFQIDLKHKCETCVEAKLTRVESRELRQFHETTLENDQAPEEEKEQEIEVITSAEGTLWKEAINSEVESILQNHTWELVDLPPGCKPLGYKWIFKRKMKPDGSIDKYKARLVIKGYRQREGLDYFDTYSSVARINSIQMIIAIAALRNLEIHQMDVKTAFLNGDLDEEIYMEQPKGFLAPGQEKKVCKLVKSLYGLKQAPKQWHEKFDHMMITSGFKINKCDKCVYVKETENGYVILCLYVDDMLIVGSDDDMIKSTKNMLKSKFDMKDMGLTDVILGIKISRASNGLILSQTHYVDKILGKFNKDDNTMSKTPLDTSIHLSKNREEGISQVEYARIIGTDHWKAIVSVFRYLRYTRNYGLHYTKYPEVLEGFSDANWISDVKDSKSTSDYVFTLAGAAVSWRSSKQAVIARSTMESEFIALDKCGEEAEWLRNFLEGIPKWPKPVPTICIHCDSQSAIGRAQSNMYNGKSRHIRRRHNTIRQLISTGVISIDYVRSKDSIADPLTKGLNRELVEKSSKGMRLKPID